MLVDAARRKAINIKWGCVLTLRAVMGTFRQNSFMGVCITVTTVMRTTQLILFSLNLPLRLPVGLIALYVKIMLSSNELDTDTVQYYLKSLPGLNDAQ